MMTRANSRKDRISVLPDLILSHILSYMPTKNAVVTSVLSKRWKFLWKGVHNLDFESDLSLGFYPNLGFCLTQGLGCGKKWSRDEDMKFAGFVNHVLLLHDGGFLNKFSLLWRPICIPRQVISWISTAITRNVHHLFLCVGHFREPIEIPSSVFGCETLRSLELDGNMFFSDSVAVVCLPRLEKLDLVSVYFQSGEAFQKLISGCPVLNLLSIKIDWDIITGYNQPYPAERTNLFTFKISSTSLRRLIINVVTETDSFEALCCSLELEAPSLESLNLCGFVTHIFVQESLSSLVDVKFIIDNLCEDQLSDVSFCNSLVEAIRAFDCAKDLYLSEHVLWALSRATISLSTKFRRLTKLKLGADCCLCSSLQDFIQISNNLEVLIVDGIWKDFDCPSYNNYSHAYKNWTTPAEVPGCLSNSLKTVQFKEFDGYDYEREMIGYMLLHGSVLEVMTIHCDIRMRDDLKLKLVREICDLPRKSPACKVNFI